MTYLLANQSVDVTIEFLIIGVRNLTGRQWKDLRSKEAVRPIRVLEVERSLVHPPPVYKQDFA